jgi:hypothetical protein
MSTLTPGRIRHTVTFTLVHEPGSEQEREFIAAQAALHTIPGVEAYELLREVSPKNDFRFGCSMEFANADAYGGYNDHPDHVAFVRDRWQAEVKDFLEIDYETL